MKLKIFSDRSYLPKGMSHEIMLYPFWGKPPENLDYPWSGRYDNYTETGDSFFEMSSLEEADLAIVPFNCEAAFDVEVQSLLIQFVERVKQAEKPLASFFEGDCSHLKLPIESDLVFRHSLYRSNQKSTDFAIPAWSEDIVKKYLGNQIIIRKKSSKPTVGFCGFGGKRDFKSFLKLVLFKSRKLLMNREQTIPPYFTGHVLRSQALSILSKSPLIKTNFVERKSAGLISATDLTQLKAIRAEFVQNMVESDYIFCCRGSGNYSFRFYETLGCGRIPVFVDTDCVLPYDFEIDWKKYCVWINESELPLIAEKIADFHENLSANEFIELQHECRRIWEQRISPEGFFSNLSRHMKNDFLGQQSLTYHTEGFTAIS